MKTLRESVQLFLAVLALFVECVIKGAFWLLMVTVIFIMVWFYPICKKYWFKIRETEIYEYAFYWRKNMILTQKVFSLWS